MVRFRASERVALACQADDLSVAYSYPGLTAALQPAPFTPNVAAIKVAVEKLVGGTFNSCHLNLYRCGADHVSWHTDEDCELLAPYVDHPLFTVENAKKASEMAVGLCKWVKAMVTYHMIAKVVIPKMDGLRLKEAELAAAQKKLAGAEAELAAAQAELDAMQVKFDAAMAEKTRLQDEADTTKRKMDSATQLLNGLAGERDRWTQQSADFADQIARLAGDCAIACGFMSYTGPFNKTFRELLLDHKFLGDLIERKIPVTKGLNVSAMLTDEATTGQWNLQGLPTDDLSTQNGILTTTAARFPLMIDPQGQGLAWIKNKEAANDCKETSFVDKAFRNSLEDCLGFGRPLLLAGVEETLDPVLDPILDKAFQKKGKGFIVALADKECDVEPENFKLYITTSLGNPHYTPELSAKVTIIDDTLESAEKDMVTYGASAAQLHPLGVQGCLRDFRSAAEKHARSLGYVVPVEDS